MPKHAAEQGPRHVAVSIVFSPASHKILMITSRAHPTLWILPKGGIEEGESSGQAAVRESWEEAGTPPTLRAPTNDERLMMLSLPTKKKGGAVWHIHVLEVGEEEVERAGEWPESHERKRAWYTPSECLAKIQEWYSDSSPLSDGERQTPAELASPSPSPSQQARNQSHAQSEEETPTPTPKTAGIDSSVSIHSPSSSTGNADLKHTKEGKDAKDGKGKDRDKKREKQAKKGGAMEMAIRQFAELRGWEKMG